MSAGVNQSRLGCMPKIRQAMREAHRLVIAGKRRAAPHGVFWDESHRRNHDLLTGKH